MASTAPEAEKTSQGIPVVRKVVVNDPNQLPLDYGTTPGGTIFSTTPGGTRIVYERKFLLQCRNSPHSKSPPFNLPSIPGVTEPGETDDKTTPVIPEERSSLPKENIAPGARASQERDDMFEMDI